MRQVVFVTQTFPTAREWAEVCAHSGVWVMISGDNIKAVLGRAGVLRSRCVLFTSDLDKQAVSTQIADAAVMQARAPPASPPARWGAR